MLQLHVYVKQNKNREKQYTQNRTKQISCSLAVMAGCVRFFEKRLKAALLGGGGL